MHLPGHSDPCRCSHCRHAADERVPLLSMCRVEFRREGRTVLFDVNFTVDHGDFVAITGPNGGGKTTLLRLMLGLLRPDAGHIDYFSADGTRHAVPPYRPGYLPQKNTVDSHFPITVGEVVASGLLGIKNLSASDRRKAIARALELTGLQELASRPIGRLSGGQLQRALFGRAIVSDPPVLVLDEPLSYIDRDYEHRMCDIVADLSHRTTILLVSHQMSEIAATANRHIIVDHTLTECTHEHHYRPPEC